VSASAHPGRTLNAGSSIGRDHLQSDHEELFRVAEVADDLFGSPDLSDRAVARVRPHSDRGSRRQGRGRCRSYGPAAARAAAWRALPSSAYRPPFGLSDADPEREKDYPPTPIEDRFP